MAEVTTPEPSRKISPSKLMGTDTPALGKVGQGGESKTGKLARILRTTRVKVNDNEKKIQVNVDKLMNVEDEQEQIHESIFSLVEKQAEQKKQGGGIKGVDAVAGSLNVIAKELTDINVVLKRQLKNQESMAKKIADENLKKERDEKEEKSESKVKAISKKIFDTIKKPFKSFFDRILKFFKNIALGVGVLSLLEWLQKPENQQKIENFTNFIIDSMPLILGGLAGILALKIGSKILKVLRLMYKLTKAFMGLARRAGKFAKNFLDRLRGTKTKGGRDITGTGTGKGKGKGRVTTSGGRVIQRGRFRGLGRGGFVGALALAGIEIFKPEIQDFVGGLYAQMGIGIRAQSDDDLIENALKLDTELDKMFESFKDIPGGEVAFEAASSQMVDEYGIYIRELTRRGLIDENGNIKGTTTTVEPGDVTSGLNFDLDLGLGDLEDEVSSVEASVSTSDSSNINMNAVTSSPSTFMKGSSSEFNTMNALSSTITGMASMMPDFSKQISNVDNSIEINQIQQETGLAGERNETPRVKIEGIDTSPILSNPSMFSGNKGMIYDIESPKPLNTTIVLPPAGSDGGPESGATGSSGPNTNEAPQFSPFDRNNPTNEVVMSIYNVMY